MTAAGRVRREVSAGGVVFRRERHRLLVLLIRDAHGSWGFPKGHIERGEQPAAAAVREVAEETAVHTVEVLGSLGTIEWTFRWRGARVHKTCHFFVMSTEHGKTCPQRDEGIIACRWLPPTAARRLLAHENTRAVLDAARRTVAAALALPHRS